MPVFTPPTRTYVPTFSADTPKNDRKPMEFFDPYIGIGVNVWLYTNNTISEVQPPGWEPETNDDGTITPGVKKVWYGGHSHTITEDEAVMLRAEGYTDNIV